MKRTVALLFVTIILCITNYKYVCAEEIRNEDKIMYAYSGATAYLGDYETVVMSFESGTPIHVTGEFFVEDEFGCDGEYWYRIDIGGEYFMPCSMLSSIYSIPSVTISYILPFTGEKVTTTIDNIVEAETAINQMFENRTEEYIVLDGWGQHYFESVWHHVKRQPLQTYYKHDIRQITDTDATNYKIVYNTSYEEEIQLSNAIDVVIPQLNIGTTYDKVKAVHDYICNNVSYSYRTLDYNSDVQFYKAYDAMFYHEAVCNGYALLFQKFMDKMGIPSYIISGVYRPSSTGDGHSWNIVNIDGKWYHIDCTWDDTDPGIKRTYFLVGSDKAGYKSVGQIQLEKGNYVP